MSKNQPAPTPHVLKIPVLSIQHSGMPAERYMAERLLAAGAPIEIVRGVIKRTGRIIEQGDKDKKHIIFSWEDEG